MSEFFNPAAMLRPWGDGDGFRVADALTGVCVFGATGSGKTSGPAKHLAYAYLSTGTETEPGFGGLILAAKPEERRQWEEWAAKCNRTQDLIIVDTSGEQRFNFLQWEADRAEEGGGLTINVVALLDEIAKAIKGTTGQVSGGDAKFFDDALHHMNTNLVDLVIFSDLALSLPLMRDIVLSAPQTLDEAQSEKWKATSVCAQVLQEAADRAATLDASAQADFAETRAYWLNEFPQISFKTRSIITLQFSMLTRPFTTRPLRRLFCEDINVKPEDTFDGKLILIDLPVQSFRLAGRVAAIAWKFCFQVAVMRRPPPAPGTPHRPVFLWADEAQNFITEQDAEYQAVARSAGGCTVYLTQNRESYRRVLGNDDTVDALLGNLQCKFFCQNSSPDTNDWAARLLGERYVYIESEGSSFSTGGDGGSASQNISEERRYYVQPSQFATLRRGGEPNDLFVEAIVYNGGYQFDDPETIAEEPEKVPYKLLTFDQASEEDRARRAANALQKQPPPPPPQPSFFGWLRSKFKRKEPQPQ